MRTLKFIRDTSFITHTRVIMPWCRVTLTLIVLFTFNSCDRADFVSSELDLNEGTKAMAAASADVSSAATEFTVVIMPDTQHYFAGFSGIGGTVAMFNSQIAWIRQHKADNNIVYVAGVGDIVEHGDNPANAAEWTNAANNGYYKLELDNIPYGLAVGNHDQGADPYTDWGNPLTSPTVSYNTKFGIDHFSDSAKYPHYKGHYGTNNDSHYDFFTAGSVDFMVIYIEYDSYNADRSNMSTWARNLCLAYPNRKAIIVTHHMIGNGTQFINNGGAFGGQGQEIYDKLKGLPNVFMFLGGHVAGAALDQGEGYREDTYNGYTIRTYMSDYQGRAGGGNGLLRLMKFSVENDEVSIKTYSPYTASFETDVSSQFTKPLFGAAPAFQLPAGKYKILAKHSGQALVVHNAATIDTARIVQWTYADNGVHNDQWNLTQIGTTGYYRISNVHSGKAMVVKNASTAYGGGNNTGIVYQYTYSADNGWNDEWALIPVGGGYYKIVARHSGLSLNVAGGNNTLGAQVKQWKYLGGDGVDNDKFQLVAIP